MTAADVHDMTAFELHGRALASTASIVSAITPDQYTLPTPCPDFTVLDLLGHLVAGNRRWVAMAQGEPAVSVPAMVNLTDADALAVYLESNAEISAAWQDPSLLDKTMVLPFGEISGGFALGMHTVETIVHGWDLARATGQPSEITPEMYEVASLWTKDIDDSLRGPGGPFGPPVTLPAYASDTERLVAWLGRRP